MAASFTVRSTFPAKLDDVKTPSAHLIERAADRIAQLKPVSAPVEAPPPNAAPIAAAPITNKRAASPEPISTFINPSVPIDVLRQAGLVAIGGRSRVMEEWRITAASLLRSHSSGAAPGITIPNTLMVTSCQPAEGKSFCALNLAATLASTGTDIILIDLDGKPRALSAVLGLGNGPGLLDLSRDQGIDPARYVLTSEIARLGLLPLGQPDDARAETGVTAPVLAALQRIGRRFPAHLLILDMPPCLATSDGATLAPHVGQIAMVVEAERTQRTELEAALGLLETCPSVNLVLNKSRASTRGHFGGGYYGYGGYYGGGKR